MTSSNKLIKDNSEVEKLKKVYSNMVNIFNACKDQANIDKGLKPFAENLITEGKAISEDDYNLLTDEDLITLDNRLSSKYDFNDTFKFSRTNTHVGSMNGNRGEEFEEIAMIKSKTNNFGLTDVRKGKSKKFNNLSKQVTDLQLKIDELNAKNSALVEDIELRDRYISQLEIGAKTEAKSDKQAEDSKDLSKIDERSEENTAQKLYGEKRPTEVKATDSIKELQISADNDDDSDGGLEE